MLKTCKLCGYDFETSDGRKNYCEKCRSDEFKNARLRKYNRGYYAKRKESDKEFIKRRRHCEKKRYQINMDKKYRDLAIQIIKIGQDIDAITKFIKEHFQLRHK